MAKSNIKTKSILVFDTPSCCTQCKFCNDETGFCIVLSKWVNNIGNTRYYYCPSKLIPEKKDEHVKLDSWILTDIINAENRGYNNAINEILGVAKDG